MTLHRLGRMATWVSLLTALPFAASAGDAAKAVELAANLCSSCHGEDGNSLVPAFPKLAGQQAVYLLRELKDYKSGKRVSEVMVPIVANLTDEDVDNLAAFYSTQQAAPGTVSDPSLVAMGKALYLNGNDKRGVPSCDGCHEEDGKGGGKFPRVAGQNVDYVLEQFRLYAAGKRTNGARVMQAVAERLKEKEIRAVAEYMASMH